MRLSHAALMLTGLSLTAQGVPAPEELQPEDLGAVTQKLIQLLNTSVTVASKNTDTVGLAPSVVSVITAETIQKYGYRDIWEAIKSVPGVTVYSGHMQRPKVVFRGQASLQNEKVLILINGQVTNTFEITYAFLPWGRLPIENVEAIEIIRGPSSALYGSGAFSGLINIKTKTVEDGVGGDITLRRGADQYVSSAVSYAQTFGDFGFAAFYSHMSDGGQSMWLPADQQTIHANPAVRKLGVCPAFIKDPQRGDEATLNLTYKGLRINSMWYAWHNSGYVPYAVANLPNTPHNTDDTLVKQIDANWDIELSPTFMLSPGLSHTDIKLGPVALITNNLTKVPNTIWKYGYEQYGGPHFKFKRDSAQVTGKWAPGENHNLIFEVIHAIERPYENFDRCTYIVVNNFSPNPNGFSDQKDGICGNGIMRDLALVLQYTWKLHPRLSILAGVRHDHFSGDFTPESRETSYTRKDFSYSTTKPRLSMVYQWSDNTILKAMFNQAMLIPTINNWTQNTPVLKGNTNVKPQNIQMGEFSISQKFNRGFLSLNLYQGRITQIIRSVQPEGATRAFFDNQGTEEQKGLELEGKFFATEDLTLGFNYSYCDVKNLDTGREAFGISKHMGTLNGEWKILPSLFLAMELQARSSQKQFHEIPAPWQGDYPGYAKINGNLRYQFPQGWHFSLGTRNLMDRQIYDPTTSNYRMPAGLPTRGRELFATLNVKF